MLYYHIHKNEYAAWRGLVKILHLRRTNDMNTQQDILLTAAIISFGTITPLGL